jgi:hypothetical protein
MSEVLAGTAKYFFKSRKKWWRRGESECSGLLKTCKLLKNKSAENAQTSKIGPNWNVSGTWDFQKYAVFQPEYFLTTQISLHVSTSTFGMVQANQRAVADHQCLADCAHSAAVDT